MTRVPAFRDELALRWRDAVRIETLAELAGRPTAEHRRRRDRLARRLRVRGDEELRRALP